MVFLKLIKMLDTIKTAKGHKLLMVLDGKHKVVKNKWEVLTIGIIVRSQRRRHTSARFPRARVDVSMHTSSTVPFFQALIDVESEANISDAFADATTLCRNIGGRGFADRSVADAQRLRNKNREGA